MLPFHVLTESNEVLDTSEKRTGSSRSSSTSTTSKDLFGFEFDFTLYLYGFQILLVAALVAITMFRKEMSCNRCYSSKQEEEGRLRDHQLHRSNGNNSFANLRRLWNDSEAAESLLETAGHYSSSSGTYRVLISAMMRTVLELCTILFLPQGIVLGAATKSFSLWWGLASHEQRLDEILDGAENWCVVPPPQNNNNDPVARESSSPLSWDTCNSIAPNQDCGPDSPLFPAVTFLPMDALVHISSFLHPRDVVSLSCTSCRARNAIDSATCTSVGTGSTSRATTRTNDISNAIWKTLWYRDFYWLVGSWKVGRAAAQRSFRSLSTSAQQENACYTEVSEWCGDSRTVFSREFYFRFSLCYANYVIAGNCTPERCLIGLGGHIYDLTSFLDWHPGSPETVIVHAGRDASSVFESMRHTLSARDLARQYCIVVDQTLLPSSAAGARPASFLCDERSEAFVNDCARRKMLRMKVNPFKPQGRPLSRRVSTLEAVYRDFMAEHDDAQRRVFRWLSRSTDSVLGGEAHVYFDPFCASWKAWYINNSIQAVFVDDL